MTPKNPILTATVALLAASCIPLRAAIVLDPIAWGLSPGDTFRLVVITYGTTPATSTSIGDYDAFVNTQGLNGITYNGSALSWQAIGQTPTSFAATDPSRYSSQANSTRVFNLAGELVSNGNFWSTHGAAIDRAINPSGDLHQFGGSTRVYTGFDYNGGATTVRDYDGGTVTSYLGRTATYTGTDWENDSPIPNQTLGVAFGRAGALANGWAWIGNQASPSTAYSMYAMSSLVTVTPVPEPPVEAAGVVLAAAAAGFGLRRHLARRRATR